MHNLNCRNDSGRKYRAIIAEDEAPLAHVLAKALNELWPDLELVKICSDGNEALSLLQTESLDIAFLDISMPYKTGIEVARQCLAEKIPTLLVLVTAYPDYALQAFEFNVCDYLVKPLCRERLAETIKRLQERLQSPSTDTDLKQHLQFLAVQKGAVNRLISVDDVCYFASDQKYVQVVTKDDSYLISKTLAELEKELDDKQFWRVHRSSIVNIRQIEQSRKTLTGRLELTMKECQDHLTVSRKYLHLFKAM
ncbi:LytR/AlgR family response regulator transcription factor [Psychromonas ossibalaenae]|uniref:LytR/AlgR family response regulator transcription factor n=1 Tax=Psychromonas ossibalaenae TaxID=444922 RepID=UPI000361EFBA|nr:LytTR family DNA-binding domain-containing protein [Psychromonas ossibalaenae]